MLHKLKVRLAKRWLRLLSYEDLKTITEDKRIIEQFDSFYKKLLNDMVDTYYNSYTCSSCPYPHDPAYMTGQEWYDRFMVEYSKDPGSRENSPTWKLIDSIAKRASGLSDE